MTLDLTAEEQYDRATRYMREHGWTQGDYRDEYGKVCLLGALAYANMDLVEFDNPDHFLAEHPGSVAFLEDVLNTRYPNLRGMGAFVARVNDDLVETEDEAIGYLEKARARAGELGL